MGTGVGLGVVHDVAGSALLERGVPPQRWRSLVLRRGGSERTGVHAARRREEPKKPEEAHRNAKIASHVHLNGAKPEGCLASL